MLLSAGHVTDRGGCTMHIEQCGWSAVFRRPCGGRGRAVRLYLDGVFGLFLGRSDRDTWRTFLSLLLSGAAVHRYSDGTEGEWIIRGRFHSVLSLFIKFCFRNINRCYVDVCIFWFAFLSSHGSPLASLAGGGGLC